MELERVEVRFDDLRVSATAAPAGRVLPSIFNSYRNFVEVHTENRFEIQRQLHTTCRLHQFVALPVPGEPSRASAAVDVQPRTSLCAEPYSSD